jgi:hypothetical protein
MQEDRLHAKPTTNKSVLRMVQPTDRLHGNQRGRFTHIPNQIVQREY